MALFSKRDQIALAVIALLILAGWGVRLTVLRRPGPDEPILIQNAVPVPEAFGESGSPDRVFIDINTASAAELETLPMIGPAKAERILDYREVHGQFRNIDDIMDVAGIGPATFDSIKDVITVTAHDSLNHSGGKETSPGRSRRE